MPYIEKPARERLEHDFPKTAGELNYVITRICDMFLRASQKKYSNHNEIVGVLECVKQEYLRRIVAVYEDAKLKENGDVYGT